MKQLLTAILMAITLSSAAMNDTLLIAHLCDPQIGFGPKGIDDDLAALRAEIENVNALDVDLVVIAGDMVNRMDSTSIALFHDAAARIEAPLVLTPGNHDIAEPCTPAGLEKYRKNFGPDFSVNKIKGRTLISFNSLLLRGGPEEEVRDMNARLDSALIAAKAEGSPVILLCHVPLFEKDIDENDEYFNLPTSIRRPLLEKFRNYGATIWLAGHTHKTHRNEYGGVTILNGENTSCNFDGRPRGFRLLSISPDGSFSWDFIPNEK